MRCVAGACGGPSAGLTFSDVFVMGAAMECGGGRPDDDDASPAPLIRGLADCGVPARRVGRDDRAAIRRVAERSHEQDAVTLADWQAVWGLERKVVVFLDWGDSGDGDGYVDGLDRLKAFSRATSQLVWVKKVYTDTDD